MYFYPRSPCGERPWSASKLGGISDISIHALLAESDTWARGSRITYVEFLSTLSLRRATQIVYRRGFQVCRYFYPRSPCGERLSMSCWSNQPVTIFLSTLSLRRATGPMKKGQVYYIISIHALLAESDRFGRPIDVQLVISIHALLAESDIVGTSQVFQRIAFLSTLSLRRATGKGSRRCVLPSISIHALLAESDCGCFARCRYLAYFYPRSPCGERLPG